MDRVFAVFAKQPLPGFAKTRLAASTSDEWATDLADAFLRDVVRQTMDVDARRVIVYTPADAVGYFSELVSGRFQLVVQESGDLGRRLKRFCEQQFQQGAEAVVITSMDSPSMPTAFIEQAFDHLQSADVVIGPATDGGYYLVGLGPNAPPVFDGIDWSGPTVLQQTVAAVGNARLRVLPPWYDVDTMDDLLALQGHLAALNKAGSPSGLVFTEALLRRGIPGL